MVSRSRPSQWFEEFTVRTKPFMLILAAAVVVGISYLTPYFDEPDPLPAVESSLPSAVTTVQLQR